MQQPFTHARRLVPLIVPLLLVVVALLQLYRAQTSLMTPWKGGGFGMFSTVDTLRSRFVRIYIETAEGTIAVAVPRQVSRFAGEVRSIPSPDRVERLAEELGRLNWVRAPQGAPAIAPEEGAADTLSADDQLFQSGGAVGVPLRVRDRYERVPDDAVVAVLGVRVEVLRLAFDPRSRQLQAVPLREMTLTVRR